MLPSFHRTGRYRWMLHNHCVCVSLRNPSLRKPQSISYKQMCLTLTPKGDTPLLYETGNKSTFFSGGRQFSTSDSYSLLKYSWRANPVQTLMVHLLARSAEKWETLGVFSPNRWKSKGSSSYEPVLKRGVDLSPIQSICLVPFLSF